MIRYLILVLALLLVAIRPAPAQQGNLPKPVQNLPAYPPVCNGRLDGRILRVAASPSRRRGRRGGCQGMGESCRIRNT